MRLTPIRYSGALSAILLTFFVSGQALAQSTGTVPSPVVRPGKSVGFAAGMAVDDGDTHYAHRLDYRHTVADKFRVSGFAFFNDRGGDYRLRRWALQSQYQIISDRSGWDSAFQMRGIIPDGDDGAPRLRLAWLNRWKSGDTGELRLVGLATREFGKNRREGLILETRSEATRRMGHKTRIGAQMFNRFNTATDKERHSVGAVLKTSPTKNVSWRVNALTGLNNNTADFELRMRISLSL